MRGPGHEADLQIGAIAQPVVAVGALYGGRDARKSEPIVEVRIGKLKSYTCSFLVKISFHRMSIPVQEQINLSSRQCSKPRHGLHLDQFYPIFRSQYRSRHRLAQIDGHALPIVLPSRRDIVQVFFEAREAVFVDRNAASQYSFVHDLYQSRTVDCRCRCRCRWRRLGILRIALLVIVSHLRQSYRQRTGNHHRKQEYRNVNQYNLSLEPPLPLRVVLHRYGFHRQYVLHGNRAYRSPLEKIAIAVVLLPSSATVAVAATVTVAVRRVGTVHLPTCLGTRPPRSFDLRNHALLVVLLVIFVRRTTMIVVISNRRG
mmetsp:Transcript_18721/g.34761  ORF Transcript_18721/g.34761 Transcript_18721/m.34761 type:complete len:315 (-) Transcript_18721:292-1236(-)